MFEIELLEKIPIAGEYDEINFGRKNELLWVLFSNYDNNEQWVGKFDFGRKDLCKVEITSENNAVILAKGKLYVVDLNNRKIIFEFEYDDYEEMLIESNDNLIVLTDGLSLYVYNYEGKLLNKTARISLDGFIFNKMEKGILYGKLNDMTEKWCDFEYDIKNNILKSNWRFDKMWS